MRGVAVVIGLLLTIVAAFARIRVVTDWPDILEGAPGDDFSARYVAHRRLGRVLLTCALVLGCSFLACLVLAFRAIRRDDVRGAR